MDAKEIITEWLKAHNCDGLCDVEHECGCPIDDLVCCDGPMLDCVPAKIQQCNGCKGYPDCESEDKSEDGECFVEADFAPAQPPGGCGKPGHVTASGDEGTNHCATCEATIAQPSKDTPPEVEAIFDGGILKCSNCKHIVGYVDGCEGAEDIYGPFCAGCGGKIKEVKK